MSDVVHGGLSDAERDALRAAGVEVVDLSANLHPDGPPPEVLDALRAVEVARYPSADGAPLREALAARHGIAPECVVMTPGAAAAIYLATAALLRPGDRCAVFTPTFGEYVPAVEAAGGEVVRVTASPPDTPPPTPPSGVALAVLCNPDNPTGRYLDRDAVRSLAAAGPHLFVDAAYEPLAEGRWAATDLVREGAQISVVHSLTKLFAMPGVRLGYAVASPEVAREMARRQPPWPLGAHAVAAGLAALEVMDDRLATVTAVHARRRRLDEALAALGLTVIPSRANFVLADVGDATAFRAALLTEGFAVRDATSFGLPGHVRIAVPAEAHLDRLLAALPPALAASPG
ncbi:MAG: histidinol-phosphate transaminase [Dehalococcoidia bacterium]